MYFFLDVRGRKEWMRRKSLDFMPEGWARGPTFPYPIVTAVASSCLVSPSHNAGCDSSSFAGHPVSLYCQAAGFLFSLYVRPSALLQRMTGCSCCLCAFPLHPLLHFIPATPGMLSFQSIFISWTPKETHWHFFLHIGVTPYYSLHVVLWVPLDMTTAQSEVEITTLISGLSLCLSLSLFLSLSCPVERYFDYA